MPRRLAAILAADVAGYTRLMSADEAGTLSALNACLGEVVAPAIASHDGRIVKLIGDGVLAEFPSAVQAVECAARIQRDMVPRDAARIRLRIGINLGDVIAEGDDIFGDGVNIAARLEGMAEPGGICLSGTIYDQLRGKLDLEFDDLGPQKLRNIPDPVRVFRIAPPGGPAPNFAAAIGLDFAIPDVPSIAVLPFTVMSADPEQEFFADGVAEDIITALSKISRLMVVA